MIKGSPKNLKLIFISEDLINFNYNKLQQFAPKIIDEFALGNNLNSVIVDIDVSNFSEMDIYFLEYISRYRQVSMDLINRIYDGGVRVLKYICVKYNSLVVCKGKDNIGISLQLHNIALEKCKKLGESPFKQDYKELLYEYFIDNNRLISALRIAIKIDKIELIQKVISDIAEDKSFTYRLFEFVANKDNWIKKEYIKIENIYIYGYAVLCDYAGGLYSEAIIKIDNLIESNKLSPTNLAKCYYVKVKILLASKEYDTGVIFIRKIINDDYSVDNLRLYEGLLPFLPEFLHNSEIPIIVTNLKRTDSYLNAEETKNSYLYLRMLQSLSEAYFDLGNYRKAISLLNRLKDTVPFYVVPHKLLQYYYYMGDIYYAEKIGLEALHLAKEYEITKDIASVYCLLAKVYSYLGMKEEAISYIDMAVNEEDSSEFIKYYGIALRIAIYSRSNKKEFPKDIGLIYAKILEGKNIAYSFLIYGAVSYWYWRNGRLEEAKFYANKTITSTTAKTGFWLLGACVAINCYLEEDTDKDMRQIVTKFLYTAEQYAMDVIIVDFASCFRKIIKFAENNKLNVEYIEKINKLIFNKIEINDENHKVFVRIMSNSAVIVNGQDIQWKTKKARELFMIYMIKGDMGIERGKIFELLWGEYIYESAINNLKTTNNLIRNTLTQYGVEYSLQYKNGKYILQLKNYEFDYEKYNNLLEKFKTEEVLAEKINIMIDLLNLYGTGFAKEFANVEFVELDKNIMQDLLVMLAEFIKVLKKEERFIDAKKFYNYLDRIDDSSNIKNLITL
jgi:two-component SAPR family response regulator